MFSEIIIAINCAIVIKIKIKNTSIHILLIKQAIGWNFQKLYLHLVKISQNRIEFSISFSEFFIFNIFTRSNSKAFQHLPGQWSPCRIRCKEVKTQR